MSGMGNVLPTYYEFFAGGGMARAGLGLNWNCMFANDIDPMKAAAYARNWGDQHLLCGDVADVATSSLPGRADLAWASFPCQDLSLAGGSAGLGDVTAEATTRSGTFWPFWALMRRLRTEGRPPRMVVLENVYGMLTSQAGRDFAAICRALSTNGYQFGAVVIDAVHFVPQSRQRVFFIAVDCDCILPEGLTEKAPSRIWHPPALMAAYLKLPTEAREQWLWWSFPRPPTRTTVFADLIEDEPTGVAWHTVDQTRVLLGIMSPINLSKIEQAKTSGRRIVGGVYRRTRPDGKGGKMQRAEIRFDDVSGCLRTPGGGSSRQTVLIVDGDVVRSRLLSPREAARLMGLPEEYRLPLRYNDAYHLAGDGVCVPVVSHLSKTLLQPVVSLNQRLLCEAAE